MHLNYLFSFFIRPIELILEFIFASVYKMTGNIGVSVIFVGLIMNTLILPIYKRADKLADQESLKKKQMKPFVTKINKAFKGDERFMMLQAFYRENNYSSLSVLSSYLSILFEIPFFIAGFHLLSGLNIVKGVPFLFINDLGKPDSMFSIGTFTVNILPILMTLINLVSSYIYTKDQDLRTKVQTYLLAAVFLVFLYNSPSCLVLYWTTNNLYSLIKNIIDKILVPKTGQTRFNIREFKVFSYKRTRIDTFSVFISLFFISFLMGALVCSDVVASNTQAFMDPFDLINPNRFILNSFLTASGMFVFWGGVIYYMLSDYGKNIMQFTVLTFSCICTIDYFGFGPGGSITPQLLMDSPPVHVNKMLLNILVVVLIIILFFIVIRNNRNYAAGFLVIETAAVLFLGTVNFINIEKDYRSSLYINDQIPLSSLSFSTEGRNVVVIMLDKGMGYMLPFILNEDPDLERRFDGFTFYPDTLSYGAYTMSGSPSLYGGYEYTPERMNGRGDVLLRDKQNEALLVMPVNFLQEGFNVTVCDPTLAGYRWIPDQRVYDEYPDINVFSMMGAFNGYIDGTRNFKLYERNFFCYGFFRLSPLVLRDLFYDHSMFNAADREYYFDFVQIPGSPSTSRGYSLEFLDSYTALKALSSITEITDTDDDNFIMFSNNAVHDPALLDETSYEPALVIDNTAFDLANEDRFTSSEGSLTVENSLQFSYYESLMSSLRALADWFDYMRENGCYDNTRIIIVADHGCDYFGETYGDGVNMGQFNPLLLVKDFDQHGFSVSDEFMTNAETSFFAFEQIISNPVNPSTGNELISDLGNGPYEVMYNNDIIASDIYDRYTYSEGSWYEVDGNVLDPDSWTSLGSW